MNVSNIDTIGRRTRPLRFCRGQAVFRWVALLALVGVLAMVGFLFANNRAHQQEVASLRVQHEQLQQEKEELEQLRGATQELERLRQDNLELVKLRGEVATLRPLQKQQQQLRARLQQAQQAGAEVAALRNQNQQLQANQQLQVDAQTKAQTDACIGNLKSIAGAKAVWALENKKTDVEVPADADLFGPDRYIAQKPACPAGGVYTLGPVQAKPTCNIPGHVSP